MATVQREKYQRLIDTCKALPPTPTAVAHPCDASSLEGAMAAAGMGLIVPFLVGPRERIVAVATANGIDLGGAEMVEAANSEASATAAVKLVREGKAEALMKGSLHTDELMAAVVRRETGLRTARRVSHCFVMDVPGRDEGLIITDAAVNIFPTLEEKADILQNAIDLAHALGIAEVRVAVLSAMETINSKVPSTIEAAALCKMMDRHQVSGALIDGPLALDNAIDPDAARIKKIDSPVAGRANVLLVPDLEAGNMLAKSLTFMAGADAAGIVLGARVPIILTSRADSLITRLASCAVAVLVAKARREAGKALGVTAMADVILVLNAGSSSLKFSVFEVAAENLTLQLKGQIEGIGTAPRFVAKSAEGEELGAKTWDKGTPLGHDGAIAHLIEFLRERRGDSQLVAVGHRVVHGGLDYAQAVQVAPEVITALAKLSPLAPLHQPHNLKPIEIVTKLRPDLPQVACFDTAFHRAQPEVAQAFALPAAITDRGVRRYGFHGLSYEYIAHVLPQFDAKAAAGRTVVAHLGNGSSMCAMVGAKSVASTMGFTAVDGLPMGTRCGNLDPGVVLYLMDELGMDARAIEALIYKQSGLLGVSGLSSDMRVLLASEEAGARRAVDLFGYRLGRELGSLAAAAGGLDALVFTAGIGEHAPSIRERLCRDAAWLGVILDPAANQAGGPRISTPESKVAVWVIPTNEELMIARHTLKIAQASR